MDIGDITGIDREAKHGDIDDATRAMGALLDHLDALPELPIDLVTQARHGIDHAMAVLHLAVDTAPDAAYA